MNKIWICLEFPHRGLAHLIITALYYRVKTLLTIISDGKVAPPLPDWNRCLPDIIDQLNDRWAAILSFPNCVSLTLNSGIAAYNSEAETLQQLFLPATRPVNLSSSVNLLSSLAYLSNWIPIDPIPAKPDSQWRKWSRRCGAFFLC